MNHTNQHSLRAEEATDETPFSKSVDAQAFRDVMDQLAEFARKHEMDLELRFRPDGRQARYKIIVNVDDLILFKEIPLADLAALLKTD